MALRSATDVLLRLRWQAARLTNLGKLGFGLCLFSLVFFVVGVLPRWTESQQLLTQIESMQAQLRGDSVQKRGVGREIHGDEALQIFYAFFPGTNSTPFWIKEVVRAADRHDVEIFSTDYRMVKEKDVNLSRYEMLIPVRGRYTHLRGFIADVLRSVPPMALVDVIIRRDTVESDLLEASLKLNLYLSTSSK